MNGWVRGRKGCGSWGKKQRWSDGKEAANDDMMTHKTPHNHSSKSCSQPGFLAAMLGEKLVMQIVLPLLMSRV